MNLVPRFARTVRPLATTLAAALGALLALAGPARAQMHVEITGVGAQQYPVAIANFATDGSAPQDVPAIIRADLTRSGLFRLVDPGAAPISEAVTVAFPDWKARGADALTVGSVARLADGRFDVRFRLYDTVKGVQLDGQSYTRGAEELRLTAHQIADRIYEKITGDKGVFATKIAYVVQFARASYELQVADADGANPRTVLKSREPIISPTWGPDGDHLAYVSFESGKAVVYVQELNAGTRKVVANYRGSSSAPSFSPDGKTLAVALSKDGNTEIYAMTPDGSNLRRLTTNAAIDTEPFYSPDGGYIYFTSDRSGGPQIYRMSASGGDATRITFNGDYNISPRISPDGKQLAYISRRNGLFQVQVLDLASGQELAVTDTVKDEAPSFAPNGRLLLYATEVSGRGILGSASADGRVRTRLTGPNGDVREPTWGPFSK